MDQPYDGPRSYLARCEELGELRTIAGADWNLEIGAPTESTSELIPEPPALLFDKVKGHPEGYRVLSPPTDLPTMEIVVAAPSLLRRRVGATG